MSLEQVDVDPPESQRLTQAHPRRDQKHPKRMVACPGSYSQQAPNFLLAECAHLLTLSARRLHGVAWIVGDQPPEHRLLQRTAQDHVDLAHSSRCQAAVEKLAKCMLDMLRR